MKQINNLDLDKYPFLKEMFNDISQKDLLNIQLISFKNKDIIIQKNKPINYVYIIIKGILNVQTINEEGHKVLTINLTSGDHVGIFELLVPPNKALANVTANGNCILARMKKEVFFDLFKKYNCFSLSILASTIKNTNYSMTFNLQTKTIDNRKKTLHYLINKCKLFDTKNTSLINLNETRDYIANNLGISVRTLNRHLQQLKKENLINIHHGKINISSSQLKLLEEALTS